MSYILIPESTELLMKISFSGFLVNLIGIFIFQHGGAGHGHSHGGGGDSHGHGHDNGKTP